ncbi:alpha/beta hydrolase [Lysinibacillus sp. NPDC097287]|uniref:alpha/beta hydrolase n=1 Tax=Lysinibacillus sp. NPDC097287 TaxID=3364144 RepID=UPI00382718ED
MAEKYPIMQGSEPFYAEGNHVGILVSHGFTGSPQSMRPLCEAYAGVGYTVCGPLLKGHGTHYEDMAQTTYQDWIHSIEVGYQWLQERCDTIFVTGLSMGGTLSLHMAEKYPEVRGIIPINAAVVLPAMESMRHITNVQFLDGIGSDIKKPGVTELAYEKTPVRSINEILNLVEEVRKQLFKITCQTLILVSDEDHVVPPYNSQIIAEGIQTTEKEICRLENSYHVATLDNDQELIINKTLAFIKKVLSEV